MNATRSTERIDEVLAAIADGRRRKALRHLVGEMGGEATVEELAEALASHPTVGDGDDVLVALHHAHVPRLEDAGIVEYDPRSGWVRYAADEPLAELLWIVEEKLE